jgi:hypothetical protein
MMAHKGWIGVDLDGTLAHYSGWKGERHVGEPVQPMLDRVKEWLAAGIEVRIFTARVSTAEGDRADDGISEIRAAIQDWCEKHGLPRLPVTNVKDFQMIQLWDDRAVAVEENTGRAFSFKPNLHIL